MLRTDRSDGGPAFPSEGEGHNDPRYHSPGMSLRDYFAAKALPVMLEALAPPGVDAATVLRVAAESSYEAADAMLEAREK